MYSIQVVAKHMSYILRRKQKIQLFPLTIILFTYIYAQENWVYRYDFTAYDDEATTIVYGLDENIYASGYSTGIGTGKDIIVISLTQGGDTNWTYRYNGQGNGDDEATSMAYGLDNNIYVAGYTTGSGTGFDMVVISLTTAGDTNWIYQYNSVNNNDVISSITYGDDNNIYVAGYSEQGNPYYYDLLVISLNNNGSFRWEYRNDPREKNDFREIIYGSDNNIYACGTCFEHAETSEFTVVCLDTFGTENWVYFGGGATLYFSYGYCIDFGLDGNIYAGGTHYLYSIHTEDLAVLSLTAAGNFNWLYVYCDSIYPYDGAVYSIEYGLDNNIYGGGYVKAEWPYIVSLTNGGDTNWSWSEHSAGSVKSIIYGLDEKLYAAGKKTNDFGVWCLRPNGQMHWAYFYDGPACSDDGATSIVFGNNNIYAAGYSTGQGSLKDITVISFQSVGIEEIVSEHIADFPFFQCFPNILIKGKSSALYYSLDRKTQVTLSIYNNLGQCVNILVDDIQQSGQYTVCWDGCDNNGSFLQTGIYFVLFNRGNGMTSEKIIIYGGNIE